MGKMRKIVLALVLALLCCGCGSRAPAEVPSARETLAPTAPAQTAPPATTPADGDPNDVTCKGTYTTERPAMDAVAARCGDYALTNEQLQVWYWMEVTAWQQETRRDAMPDWSQPLDTQVCPIDGSVGSWQQFFLQRALKTWHSVCALELRSRQTPLPVEDAYNPNLENHQIYLTGKPATKYLYGYNPLFTPNSMHEAYLNALPQTLEQLAQQKGFGSLEEMAGALGVSAGAVEEVVRLYNYSYAYYTTLSYDTDPAMMDLIRAQTAEPGQERVVTVRQILLVPEGAETAEDGTVSCTEEQWAKCRAEAEELEKQWNKRYPKGESTFADMARKHSDDAASGLDGGELRGIRRGQLLEPLEGWCFDEARQPGDVAILQSAVGMHILYFCQSEDAEALQREEDRQVRALGELLGEARMRCPAEYHYSAMELGAGEPAFSLSDTLYPDIAHERFPEMPLYLQQDYAGVVFGGEHLAINGCGITTLAMVASYMTDEEWTPPELVAIFNRYGSSTGTDGMIFNNETAAMGFYLREKTYDVNVARAALEEGQVMVNLQHQGYWTRGGGHYIALESIDEEGMVQVRDSHIFNYGRIMDHELDRHTWRSVTSGGDGYWIFEDKLTHFPLCSRCGDGEGASPVLSGTYICKKCGPALVRRNSYLNLCAQ